MTPYRALSLDDLCPLIRESDQHAFSEVFERTWSTLYTIARSKVSDQDLAKELVQEVFIDLWEKRERRRITHILPYLKQALRFKVIDHYSKHHLPSQDVSSIENLIADTQSADDRCHQEDIHTILRNWMNHLPKKRRAIFELYLLEHRSTKEIGEILHISTKTVQNQLLNGRHTLQLFLKKWLTIFFLIFFGSL